MDCIVMGNNLVRKENVSTNMPNDIVNITKP